MKPLFASKKSTVLSKEMNSSLLPITAFLNAHHVVDGIVDSLDHLLLPVARRPLLSLPPPALLPLPPAPVEHVVDVHGAVELSGPDPLEEHGGAGLAHQGHDVGAAGRPHVGPDGGRRLVGFPLVLGGEGPHPDLVLAVGLWGRQKGI
jgi:hypothetical protein